MATFGMYQAAFNGEIYRLDVKVLEFLPREEWKGQRKSLIAWMTERRRSRGDLFRGKMWMILCESPKRPPKTKPKGT